MKTNKDNTTTRRSALMASLRWGAGGLMALAVGLLVSRKQLNRENT